MRRVSLTRAQLIGGLFATGAVAACAGGATPNVTPTPSPLCPAAPSNPVGVGDIFSDPVFDGLDKKTLAQIFDPASKLQATHQGYFAQTGQQLQTDSVIRQIPSGGIIIKTPGTYTFANDISWSPNIAPASAITIACNNVTLDLKGFTLTVGLSDQSLQIAGISLLGTDTVPLNNITVVNGTVANATEHGIQAISVCGLKIANLTVTGLCMKIPNLNQPHTTLSSPAAIFVSKCIDVALSGCYVSQVNVTTDSSAAIFLLATIQATVSDCHVSSLLNNDGAVQGFSSISCINVTTTGCTAQTLQSRFNGNTSTTGHTVLGFCPIFCWDLIYVDCSATGLTGCCDDCHAFSVFLDGLVKVIRFRGDQVVDGVTPSNSGAKATGLEVYGVNVTITDCTVSNIKAINPQDKQASGFSAWGLGILFQRCSASFVSVQDDLGNGSRGEGFGWAPDPRPYFIFPAIGVTYEDCVADHCDVGFDTWNHQLSTWIRPSYTNCTVGILVESNTATRHLTCDPCSECPGFFPPTPRPGPTGPPPTWFSDVTNVAFGNSFPP